MLKPFAVPLPTVKDVERFTKKVWASKRVQEAFPKAVRDRQMPAVKDGRGRRNAGGCSYLITIPLWARTSNVVLHELAHTITDREYGWWTAGHGWQFCHVFLTLTLYIMGREAHDAFKKSMKKHRVRFRPPRKRKPMDPDRREKLLATLAAARQRKEAVAFGHRLEAPAILLDL